MSRNQKKANVTDGKGTEKRRFIQILGQFWASFVRKSSSSRFWSQLLPDNCEVLKKPLSHGEDMMRNGVGANLFTPVIFVGTQTHCSPYKKKATYDYFLSQNKNKENESIFHFEKVVMSFIWDDGGFFLAFSGLPKLRLKQSPTLYQIMVSLIRFISFFNLGERL